MADQKPKPEWTARPEWTVRPGKCDASWRIHRCGEPVGHPEEQPDGGHVCDIGSTPCGDRPHPYERVRRPKRT
jgi:hypothetical protein